MHVGVFLSSLKPTWGGGFTFEDDLREGLIERHRDSKHRFSFIGLAPSGPTDCHIPYHSICPPVWQSAWHRVRRLNRRLWQGSRFEGPFEMLRPKSIWRQLKPHHIDVIWGLSPGMPIFDWPMIATIWDLQHRRQPFFPEVSRFGIWEWRENYFGRLLRRAAAIITPNQVGREEIERFYGVLPERIWTLPHPTPRFALMEAAKPHIPQILERFSLPRPFVFYPAQFWPHKNHVTVLHVLKHLQDRYGVTFHVVFTGADHGTQGHVRQVAEQLGVARLVRFLGFVERSELIALYRESRALLYLTLFGPENLPPLEAFALGCPVVASNVPGAVEQLGQAALLVNPLDVEAAARAIMDVHTQPELRQQLIERGQERARRYTVDHFLQDVFNKLDAFARIGACWMPST